MLLKRIFGWIASAVFVVAGTNSLGQAAAFFKIDPAGAYLPVLANDIALPPSTLNLAGNGISAGDVIEIKVVGAFNTAPDWHEFGGDRWTHAVGSFFSGSTPIAPGTGSTVGLATTAKSCGSQYFYSEIAEDFYLETSWVRLVVPGGATSMKLATNDCYFRDNFDANADFGMLWRHTQLNKVLVLNPLAKALPSRVYTVRPGQATDAPAATAFSADGRSAVLVAVNSNSQSPVTFTVNAGRLTSFSKNYLLTSVAGSQTSLPVMPALSPCDAAGCVYLALLWPPDEMPANAGSPPAVPITVQATQNSIALQSATITLRPPPVLFVHGIWSSAAQAKFSKQSGGMRDWMWARYGHNHLNAADYGALSDQSFGDSRVQTIFETSMYNLLNDAATNGMTARTVDVVAHSMGGLVTRYFLSKSQMNSAAPPSPVRRLIGIGTPHKGSLLAARLSAAKPTPLPALVKESVMTRIYCEFAPPPVNVCTLGGVLGLINKPVATAVESLSPTSEELKKLSAANVFDAVVGVAPGDSMSERLLNDVIGGFLPGESVASILGTTAHDTIVTTDSQRGLGAARTAYITDVVHTNIYPFNESETASHRVWSDVYTRLTNAQPAPGFSNAEPSVKSGPLAPTGLPNLDLTGYSRVAASTVTFSPTSNSQLVVGALTSVTASSATKTISQFLLLQFTSNPSDVAFMDALQAPFSIAYTPTRLGVANFVAVTTFTDQTYAVSSLSYTLQASSAPSALTLTGAPSGSLRVGMTASVRAFADLTNGSIDVTSAAIFATRSGSSTVVSVSPNGVVSTVGVGTEWLDVSYGGRVSSAQFVVYSPPVVSIDVDGSGSYRALTDGLVILRYLIGLEGAPLVAGVTAASAAPIDASAMTAKLDKMLAQLDVDGNGRPDSADGLLIVRYLFGLRGSALIAGAIGQGAIRETAAKVETYIQSLMP